MDIEQILADLPRIELPDSGAGDGLTTLSESLREMIALGRKAGQSGFRAAQNAQHVAKRLDELAGSLARQAEEREQDLRAVRSHVGELQEEVDRLLGGLIQVGDLVDAAASRRGDGDTPGDAREVLLREVGKVLRRIGLEPLAKVGEPHDPEFHEPIAQEPAEGRDRRQIVEVVRQGYRFRGRVVRTARVVITQ